MSAGASKPQLALPRGSVVALVTPMEPDGSVDEQALRALLQWHLTSGTHGVVILGTTGESSMMSHEERQQVIDVTMEELGGKMPIIVGTGAIDVRVVIKQQEQAKAGGADASLVVTPAYVKPTQKGLIQFFKHIADEVDLPMVLYNVPGRTRCDMLPETIAECCTHPLIQGVKEATGELARVAKLRELCSPQTMLYSGDDGTAMEFVLQGGQGVISVTSNVAPERMAQMMDWALKGDRDKADELNQSLEALHDKLFIQPSPTPVKWGLEQMGRIQGGIRLPLLPLEEHCQADVEHALRRAGALPPKRPAQ